MLAACACGPQRPDAGSPAQPSAPTAPTPSVAGRAETPAPAGPAQSAPRCGKISRLQALTRNEPFPGVIAFETGTTAWTPRRVEIATGQADISVLETKATWGALEGARGRLFPR